MHIKQLLAVILYVQLFAGMYAQGSAVPANIIADHRYDSVLYVKQQEALNILINEDTTAVSAYWPNISAELFFANVRKNILFPDKIHQGRFTNFCGYAALTHLLLLYYPDLYTKCILSLYHKGNATLEKKTLKPTEKARRAAGTLKNKCELNAFHADQLWFLALADQFKGYMNFIDPYYNPGDENTIWAGTNYGKFNRMLTDFTGNKLICRGSDFLKPFKNNIYEYISGEFRSGIVVLYVNPKYLKPPHHSFFSLRAPTHFIVLYDIRRIGDMIEIQYWDYGSRTKKQIPKERLRQLIYGITTITDVTNETY